MVEATLANRLDRLESIEAIRQLAYGYAFALDARDLEAIARLYVATIRVGAEQGRAALKTVFEASLRQFTASAHHVTNHLVEFMDQDNALGLVACRVEHEVADQWVTASLVYHDRYERVDRTWLFRGRVQSRLYATAHHDPPVGPAKLRWPGTEPSETGFHETWPSWTEFWDGVQSPDWGSEGAGALVSRLRRGQGLPRPPRYQFKE